MKEFDAVMAVLATNSSARAIARTAKARTLICEITGDECRKRTLNAWKTALFEISTDNACPSDRYGSIREATHVVTRDLIGAIWDIGGTYEDVWNVNVQMLAWLDGQCRAMKPVPPPDKFDWRAEMAKWSYYGALVEHRECVIENLERDGFDDRFYHVGEKRIGVAKKKFEQMIGRPVRPMTEIKRLGFYAKKARKRIEAERNAALKITPVIVPCPTNNVSGGGGN